MNAFSESSTLPPLVPGGLSSDSGIVKSSRYQRFPISSRGILLGLFALYLVIFPGRVESDVVAAIVGYTLLSLLAISALTVFVQSVDIRESLQLHSSAELFEGQSVDAPPASPVAGSSSRVVTSLSPVSLVPLTILEVELVFERPGVNPARHVVAGRSRAQRLLIEDLVFPHRGQWRCSAVRCRVRDVFGLTRVEWLETKAAKRIAVEVRPPQSHENNLPVVSSSVRAGDALSDMVERQGDPFDLKAYHPADGLRRVLWKLFAKRGELVARHPERAVTPEGQVICFVIADSAADHVCAEAIQYAKQLEQLDLQLWFGASGMKLRSAARSSSMLESLLIESVWDASDDRRSNLLSELRNFLGSVERALQHSRIDKVVLFVSQAQFRAEKDGIEMANVLSSIFPQNTQPLIVATPEPQALSARSTGGAQAFIERLFYAPTSNRTPADPSFFKKFLLICAARGWEVIIP